MSFKRILVVFTLVAVGYLLMTRSMPKSFSEIGSDAYTYGYPAVLMDKTKEVMTNTAEVTETKAPVNQFLNAKAFPKPDFKDVVSPNVDTLYSTAWLDLTKEPIILSVPAMHNRYYLMEMLDLWTNVFASPGTRTTGSEAGSFAIVGPDWNGRLPEGVREIKAPTHTVWIIGRTETNGPQDYAAVHQIQDQYKLVPLSAWGSRNYTPPAAIVRNLDHAGFPAQQVEEMDGEAFLEKLNQLLQTSAPERDAAMLGELADIGIGPGKTFNFRSLSDQEKAELLGGMQKAKETIKKAWASQELTTKVNNWNILRDPVGNYGTDYFARAVIAYGGLGANLPQDALYPITHVDSEGNPLNGVNNYVIHFDKNDLPQVRGFWSITAYNDQQFFMENPIHRYAIGDRSDLLFNADGSLDIYVQSENPGLHQESNWLPVGKENFNLIFRLYGPSKDILDGTWKPPLVQKIN